MFFDDLLFDGKLSYDSDRGTLLWNLLQKYDEDIQTYFLDLYQLILTNMDDNIMWGFDKDHSGISKILLEESN